MQRLDEFAEECLREHNIKRSNHGATPLIHSRALDQTAQDWAEKLIYEEGIKNSPFSSRGDVGESISVRTSSGSHVDVEGQEVVNQWYADIKNYNFDNGKGPAGNFTQLVWNSTREVGFGKARSSGKCVVVAHYRPPGNIVGRHLENVFRPQANLLNETTPSTKKSDFDVGTPKTVVVETITEADGKKYGVRKEISQITDEFGKVRRCVNEVYNELNDTVACKLPNDNTCFVQSIIDAHNVYRKKHGANPLFHDQQLTDLAQKWANHLLDETHLSNSGIMFQGTGVGENIGSRWSNGPTDYSSQELVDHWYQESEKYKYDREPGTIQGIGNFTQMIWASSQRMGVGKACRPILADYSGDKSRKIIIVCFYYPPGNVIGNFINNVKQPIDI